MWSQLSEYEIAARDFERITIFFNNIYFVTKNFLSQWRYSFNDIYLKIQIYNAHRIYRSNPFCYILTWWCWLERTWSITRTIIDLTFVVSYNQDWFSYNWWLVHRNPQTCGHYSAFYQWRSFGNIVANYRSRSHGQTIYTSQYISLYFRFRMRMRSEATASSWPASKRIARPKGKDFEGFQQFFR